MITTEKGNAVDVTAIQDNKINDAMVPAFSDTFKAAFTQNNPIASAMAYGIDTNQSEIDANYDPFQDTDIIGDYDPKFFAEARNYNHAIDIRHRLDLEKADREIIGQSGWGSNLIGALAGGVTDPINWLIAPAVGGGSIARVAAKTALASAGTVAASESVLQNIQDLRTKEESAVNIVAGAVLGGLLGGAVRAYTGPMKVLEQKVLQDLDGESALTKPLPEQKIAPTNLEAAKVLETETPISTAKAEVPSSTTPQAITAPIDKTPWYLKNYDTGPKQLALETADGRIAWVSTDKNVRGAQEYLQESTLVKPKEELEQMIKQGATPEEVIAREAGLEDVKPYDVPASTVENSSVGAAQYLENNLQTSLAQERLIAQGVLKATGVTRFSPTARFAVSSSLKARQWGQKLADDALLRQKNIEGVAAPISFRQVLENTQADEFRMQVLHNDSFSKAKAIDSSLTKATFDRELSLAMADGDTSANEAITEAAHGVRAILDKYANEAVDSGLLVKGSFQDKSYFPVIFDKEAIRNDVVGFKVKLRTALMQDKSRVSNDLNKLKTELADKRAFGSDIGNLENHIIELENYVGQTPAESEVIVDSVVGKLLGTEDTASYISPKLVDTPSNKFLKERTLDLKRADVIDYVHSDVRSIVNRYAQDVNGDLRSIEYFGDARAPTTALQEITDDYSHLMKIAEKNGQPKEVNRLQGELKDRLDTYKDLYNQLRGFLPMNSKFDGLVKAGRNLRNITYMSSLGNVLLSSLPDLAATIGTHGFFKVAPEAGSWLKLAFGGMKATKKELNEASIALNSMMNTRVASVADLVTGQADNSVTKVLANKFSKYSLINWWNDAMQSFNGFLYMKRALDSGEDLIAGKALKPRHIAEFAQLGMDEDLMKRAATQYSKYGEKDSGSLVANFAEWDDKPAAEAMQAMMKKAIDTVIVLKKKGDAPLILENEASRTMLQFMGYIMGSTTKVAAKQVQRLAIGDTARVAQMIVGMTGVGMGAAVLKDKIAGRVSNYTTMGLIAAGMDQGGFTGVYGELLSKVDAAFLGHKLANMLGGSYGQKYRDKSPLEVVGGPVLGGLGTKVGNITSDLAKGKPNGYTIDNVRRLLPFNNIFYLKKFFDIGEDTVTSVLGLKKKKKK